MTKTDKMRVPARRVKLGIGTPVRKRMRARDKGKTIRTIWGKLIRFRKENFFI